MYSAKRKCKGENRRKGGRYHSHSVSPCEDCVEVNIADGSLAVPKLRKSQCPTPDNRGRWSGTHRQGAFGHGLADGPLERLRRLGSCDQVAIVDHHGGHAAYPCLLPFIFGMAHLVGVAPGGEHIARSRALKANRFSSGHEHVVI